jgi:hypothetical protein
MGWQNRIHYCTSREPKHRQPAYIPPFIKKIVLLPVCLSTYLCVYSVTGIMSPAIQPTYEGESIIIHTVCLLPTILVRTQNRDMLGKETGKFTGRNNKVAI